ncbi:hypothetical protein HYFRA_00008968 [Hymenoscyphus fraxineus]|uniref:2EXR domain-containing protein n=1 Tax=Hymenoscyphus fraxineus TaxID=746836 RepID=A0A9N9KRS9_9HELO|nr:hypothetical protein HYFRA_00008968 [Hymenoscyphus fraxineus]
MDILRNDGFGLGTQEAVGLQQALLSTFDNTNHATRAPERDIYDLPSSPVSTQHEPSSSPVRSPTEFRVDVIDLVSEGSPSRAASSSDGIPSSQQSDHENEEEDEIQVANMASNNAVVGLDASANTGIDLKEFTLFRKLPAEIRVMIWKATIQPRLVVIRDTMATRDYREGKETGDRDWDYIFSTTPIPGPIFACKESREAMMSCGYKLSFKRQFHYWRQGRVWYNNEVDILYISPLEPGAQTVFPFIKMDWEKPDFRLKRMAIAFEDEDRLSHLRRITSYDRQTDMGKIVFYCRIRGCPMELLLVEEHCGHCPLTSGHQQKQSSSDPWTWLKLEEGLIEEKTFPTNSLLDKRFGPLIKAASLSDNAFEPKKLFHDVIDDLQKAFGERNIRLQTAYGMNTPSISRVMVMKSSQAQALIKARTVHSNSIQDLDNDKQKLVECRRRLSEAQKDVDAAEKRIEAREASIKIAQKSVEDAVHALHSTA